MKELIPMDEYGVFADMKDTARVSSLYVAEFFEKEHKHVMRDIRDILSADSGLSKEFGRSNFGLSSYINSQNKKQPCYCMTRDGFTMLTMGYTGKKAMKFKELYIRRFNEMEKTINSLVTARLEFPKLTEQIKLLHENPKPYHFSNECDMINRLVLGMSAKQFRIANGIEAGKDIRPYLTKEQLDELETLQMVDVGFLLAFPDYEERKHRLESYKEKKFSA